MEIVTAVGEASFGRGSVSGALEKEVLRVGYALFKSLRSTIGVPPIV